MEIIEDIVEKDGPRVDQYLYQKGLGTRTQIQSYIKAGHLKVNDSLVKASYAVKKGDRIRYEIPDPKPCEILPEDIPLDIVYEDEDVIVINKPSGMIVHPGPGVYTGTLVNALLYHCHDLSGINGVLRPGIVHRLDKDTSGLIMVAKNDQSHQELARQLADKTAHRVYIALVHGVVDHNYGRIEAPIGRDPADRQSMTVTARNGKPAVTEFKVLRRYAEYTLLQCQLETGRTHQIRVHLRYIGYPVAGDPKYGYRRDRDTEHGQYLHAAALSFHHPKTGAPLFFTCPLPDWYQARLEILKGDY